MKNLEKELAKKWFIVADDDLKSARNLFGDGIYRNVCFLSQQVAEKYLKGLLANNNIEFKKTHKLTELIKCLLKHKIKIEIQKKDLTKLDSYYIEPRYPDAYFEIYNKREAEEALNLALKIVKTVKQILESK